MTVLSDYVNDTEMEITFNKRVLNPVGGKDGYLIRSLNKYIAVLPDDYDQVDKMFGSELLKNIDISPDTAAELPEPVITHTVVFAPEQYDPDGLPDERTDQYALGAVLFFASTGKRPDPSRPAGR